MHSKNAFLAFNWQIADNAIENRKWEMGNAKESPSCIVCHLLAICIAGERRTKHNLSLPTHPQAAYIQKIKIFWVKSTYTEKNI